MKIYLASSWRNPYQQNTVGILRSAGHEVYDFQHPPGGDHLGFSWSDVDLRWTSWTPEQYLEGLQHPIAKAGFESDFGAMIWADACVLLLPSGRSAHLEAGFFVGARKSLVILLDRAEFQPDAGHSVMELMYSMANVVTDSIEEVLASLSAHVDKTSCMYGCTNPMKCPMPHPGCGHCYWARYPGGVPGGIERREGGRWV